MKDFTLESYRQYLRALASSYTNICRFDEYFAADLKPEHFCIIRHDVDRKPKNALRVARLESEMNISASYFFRAKAHTFKPEIIREIVGMGHELGYHYESLSDAKGDISIALKDFETHLRRFRDIAPVKTISMHGRPFSPFNNNDLWSNSTNYRKLTAEFRILGDVSVDIDYADIEYINDTGRNWSSSKANKRDIVDSGIQNDFSSRTELLAYLESNPHNKLIFSIHPERWTDAPMEYIFQMIFDFSANTLKEFL